MSKEINSTELWLKINNRLLASTADINEFFNQKLYSAVDGAGLRESNRHGQAHRWVREPTAMLSGKDFLNCVRTKINALPSTSKTTRGRANQYRMCRAGCQSTQTTYYIIQACHRTAGARIDRHNSVAAYDANKLNSKGYTVIEEPKLNTVDGLQKPDILALKDGNAVILDALQTIESITISWRGVWSQASANELIRLGAIKTTDTAVNASTNRELSMLQNIQRIHSSSARNWVKVLFLYSSDDPYAPMTIS
ncbi:hypothetical protein GQX74_001864 [Glossina fuscipes]|nr:hypothetical protein GQX74_001864 [Glossina fuscipes]